MTGGGSGIGKALVRELIQFQKPIVIIGRREQLLQETAQLSPFISYICANVATKEGREQISHYFRNEDHITALVHNAGVIDPIESITKIEEEAWQNLMAINVNAPLFLTQLLFKKLKGGRVLHIGSGAAYLPIKGWAPYCVSKASLSMLNRCWQIETEEVSFASVLPGIIDTHMQAVIRQAGHMDNDKKDFFKNLYKDGKLLAPETVALFLKWLLCDLDREEFSSKEWDIYNTEHHGRWLNPPHVIFQPSK